MLPSVEFSEQVKRSRYHTSLRSTLIKLNARDANTTDNTPNVSVACIFYIIYIDIFFTYFYIYIHILHKFSEQLKGSL